MFQNTSLIEVFDDNIEIHHFHNILMLMEPFVFKSAY